MDNFINVANFGPSEVQYHWCPYEDKGVEPQMSRRTNKISYGVLHLEYNFQMVALKYYIRLLTTGISCSITAPKIDDVENFVINLTFVLHVAPRRALHSTYIQQLGTLHVVTMLTTETSLADCTKQCYPAISEEKINGKMIDTICRLLSMIYLS